MNKKDWIIFGILLLGGIAGIYIGGYIGGLITGSLWFTGIVSFIGKTLFLEATRRIDKARETIDTDKL